jgi:hypothetical protein
MIKRRKVILRKRKQPGVRAQARKAKHRTAAADERAAKREVRERDRRCRFPRCGCDDPHAHWMKRILTVSHDFHKGMGGDPSGAVSIPPLMLLLCKWRHQDAPVSRDRKTLRTRYLTPDQNEGPIAFEIDLHALDPDRYTEPGTWFEVARETYVEGGSGELRLEPLSHAQEEVLDELAEMQR